VRIPLSLARAAGKFIPRHAQQHLAAYNINLEEFLSGLSDAEGDRTLVEVKNGKDCTSPAGRAVEAEAAEAYEALISVSWSSSCLTLC
jgi:hypothetical protein